MFHRSTRYGASGTEGAPEIFSRNLGQDGSTEPRRARRFDQRSIHDLESNCPGRASIGVDRRALVQNFTFNGPDVQSVLTRAPILVGEIPEGIRYCGAQLHADKCGYNGSRIVARGNPTQTRPMTVGSTAVSKANSQRRFALRLHQRFRRTSPHSPQPPSISASMPVSGGVRFASTARQVRWTNTIPIVLIDKMVSLRGAPMSAERIYAGNACVQNAQRRA